ncbi:MAG: membrane protein insertion efficiency factor YidD [Firmicutes bacterium HGW-Firmicutes-8]|nr:MAG: membrane protein insertion efficiency factor YidD [Firmicutes bacterium HGW-Firmicutes-8]
MKSLVIAVIQFYRKVISPLKPSACRFYPTCSEYAVQAVQKYGVIRGVIKALGRILRCHPFNPGGFDPVQ